MKTRIIYTKFWDDSYISELTTSEKLVFIYYLTNALVNIIHCYECPDKKVTYDTGVNKEVFVKIKEKFQNDRKICFYKDFVFLTNAYRYERYIGEDNEKAKERFKRQLPLDVLDWYNNIKDTPVYTPVYTTPTPPINNKYILKIEDVKEKEKKTAKNSLIPCTNEELYNIARLAHTDIDSVLKTHTDVLMSIKSGEFQRKKYGTTVYFTLLKWVRMGIQRGTIEERDEFQDMIFKEFEPEKGASRKKYDRYWTYCKEVGVI